MNSKTILSAYGKASAKIGYTLKGFNLDAETKQWQFLNKRERQLKRFRKALEERLDLIQAVSEESLDLIKDLIGE